MSRIAHHSSVKTSNTVQFYTSLRKNAYACKQSYFNFLLSIPNQYSLFNGPFNKLVQDFFMIYLQQKSKLISSQMLRFDVEIIKTLDSSISGSAKNVFSATSNNKPNLNKGSVYEVFEIMKNLVFPSDNTITDAALLEVVRSIDESVATVGNPEVYEKMFSWINVVVSHFESFFNAYNNLDQTPIVRLFNIGSEKYMMARELMNVMEREKMEISNIVEDVESMKTIKLLKFKEAFQKVGSGMKHFEFTVSDFTALVPTCDGEDYCGLASDALLEIVYILISANKIFLNVRTTEERNAIDKIIEYLNSQFRFSNDQGVFLIDSKTVLEIRKMCDDILAECQNPERIQVEIRDLKKEEWTEEDLEAELDVLELSNIFPDIMEIGRKQIKDLKDSTNFISSIEHLQVFCFFEKFPEISQFLHNQKACSKLLNPQCEFCFPSTPEVQEIVEELTESKEATSDSTPGTSSDPQESISDSSDNSIELKKKKKNKKSSAEKRKLRKQKMEEKAAQETESVAEKQVEKCEKCSEACQKCYRTNEVLQKAKTEIKSKDKKLAKMTKENVKLTEEKDYWKKLAEDLLVQLQKQQIQEESPKEEIIDMECLVCHDDMETTEGTLKCSNCSRHYHKNCLVQWFQKSRACPVCDKSFPEGVEN